MEAGVPPPVATVRKATVDDVPRLARALATAFYEDPVFRWLVPDDSERLRRSERGFSLYLRKVYLQHDECYTTEDVVGGALWMPPGTWHLGPLAQLRLLPGWDRYLVVRSNEETGGQYAEMEWTLPPGAFARWPV